MGEFSAEPSRGRLQNITGTRKKKRCGVAHLISRDKRGRPGRGKTRSQGQPGPLISSERGTSRGTTKKHGVASEVACSVNLRTTPERNPAY